MAKIIEEVVVIRLSKLVKDSEPGEIVVDNATLAGISDLVQQLVGENIVVELITAE